MYILKYDIAWMFTNNACIGTGIDTRFEPRITPYENIETMEIFNLIFSEEKYIYVLLILKSDINVYLSQCNILKVYHLYTNHIHLLTIHHLLEY